MIAQLENSISIVFSRKPYNMAQKCQRCVQLINKGDEMASVHSAWGWKHYHWECLNEPVDEESQKEHAPCALPEVGGSECLLEHSETNLCSRSRIEKK